MHGQRAFLTAFLLGAIVFSGCVGGNADDASSTETAAATLDAGQSTDSMGPVGAVQGMVRTDELQPIAGAVVALLKTTYQVETDAAGSFAFTNLPIGEYSVIGQKLGYESRAQKVVVTEGATTWLNLTLIALAAEGEAYTDSTQHTTTLQCMLVTGIWVSACSYPYTAVYLAAHGQGVNLTSLSGGALPPDIMANKWRYNYSLAPDAKTVVSELGWKAQSEMAKKMFIKQCRPDYDPVLDHCNKEYAGSSTGGTESPITVHWNPKAVYAEKAYANWVMSAVWPAFPGFTSTNQGVYLEQKVEMWNTEFYGAEAKEDWSVFAPTSG